MPRVGAESIAREWGWGEGTAGLLSRLPRAVVAAGTEVLRHAFARLCGHSGARGRARAPWDIPDAVCCGLKPSIPAPSWGLLGPGGQQRRRQGNQGTVPPGLCQDHRTQHPTVLISHGFGHAFSNLQSMTNSATPETHAPCNPNPCKPPKTSSRCSGVLQKAKTTRWLPLWDHTNQSWQCHGIPVPR